MGQKDNENVVMLAPMTFRALEAIIMHDPVCVYFYFHRWLFKNKMQIVPQQEHVWQNGYHHENHIEILHLSI